MTKLKPQEQAHYYKCDICGYKPPKPALCIYYACGYFENGFCRVKRDYWNSLSCALIRIEVNNHVKETHKPNDFIKNTLGFMRN